MKGKWWLEIIEWGKEESRHNKDISIENDQVIKLDPNYQCVKTSKIMKKCKREINQYGQMEVI